MAETALVKGSVSGVTRVGVIRGNNCNDGVTPIFPEKKLTTSFSHRRLQSDEILGVRLCLSIVLSKFSHIFYFNRLSPRHPPGDATGQCIAENM